MPKRLFIGGPLDGEVRDVPELAWTFTAERLTLDGDLITERTVIYHAVQFGPEMYRTTVFVHGNQPPEAIFWALLEAAGVDR